MRPSHGRFSKTRFSQACYPKPNASISSRKHMAIALQARSHEANLNKSVPRQDVRFRVFLSAFAAGGISPQIPLNPEPQTLTHGPPVEGLGSCTWLAGKPLE